MSSRPYGDSRVRELKRQGQNLCSQDLGEPKKQEVQQKVKGVEERWTNLMQTAKQTLDQAERKCALESQLRNFKAMSENTRAWLDDKQRSLDSLSHETDPEKTRNTAQVRRNKRHVHLSKFIDVLLHLLTALGSTVVFLQ